MILTKLNGTDSAMSSRNPKCCNDFAHPESSEDPASLRRPHYFCYSIPVLPSRNIQTENTPVIARVLLGKTTLTSLNSLFLDKKEKEKINSRIKLTVESWRQRAQRCHLPRHDRRNRTSRNHPIPSRHRRVPSFDLHQSVILRHSTPKQTYRIEIRRAPKYPNFHLLSLPPIQQPQPRMQPRIIEPDHLQITLE
jgi:hypothetical protein